MGFQLGGLANGKGGTKPCCCGGSCTTKVCLISPCGTSNPATGVVVTIKSGATVIDTQTVGSDGCATLTIPSGGSYTVTTTGNGRYANTSQTETLSCNGSINLNLSAATGYACECAWNEPIPNALFLTVLGTTYPFTLVAGNATVVCTPTITNLMTQNHFGTCSGALHTNLCTTGSGVLNLPITITTATGGSCQIGQTWSGVTDCTQTPNTAGCPAISSYIYYANGGPFINGLNGQYTVGGNCFGFCSVPEFLNISLGTGNPVPVNLTVTFPTGPFGTPPPAPTATLTE